MVRQHLQRLRADVARLIAWLIFRGPVVIGTGRTRMIFDPRSNRLIPIIAGGAPEEGEGEGAGSGEGEGSGSGDGSGEGEGEGEGAGSGEGEGSGSGDGGGDGEGSGSGDGAEGEKIDWKLQSRKHERQKKAEKKRADELAAELKTRQDADKSEQEKAVEAAREEAKAEVTSTYETERRSERLELAVTRQANKGVKVGTGDDAKTLKFADPDDALAHLERAIKRGDIDGDDLYDDTGKIQSDALVAALVELLEDKPHLAATNGNGQGSGRGAGGGADAGRGGGGGKALEEMTTDDHLKAIQGR